MLHEMIDEGHKLVNDAEQRNQRRNKRPITKKTREKDVIDHPGPIAIHIDAIACSSKARHKDLR
jgi:hypothetical protein